jgi:hypothetical protein
MMVVNLELFGADGVQICYYDTAETESATLGSACDAALNASLSVASVM